MEKISYSLLSEVSDQTFTEAIGNAVSYQDLLRKLGFHGAGGTTYNLLHHRITALGLSTTHFPLSKRRIGRTKDRAVGRRLGDINDQDFAAILAQVDRFSTFRAAAGIKTNSGNLSAQVRARAARLGLSMAHFAFQRRDVNRPSSVSVKTEAIFKYPSVWAREASNRILKKLFDEGLRERRCEKCGNGPLWEGEELHLMLHRIENVRSDLRLENLEVRCPNCWYQGNKPELIKRVLLATKARKRKLELKRYQKILDKSNGIVGSAKDAG